MVYGWPQESGSLVKLSFGGWAEYGNLQIHTKVSLMKSRRAYKVWSEKKCTHDFRNSVSPIYKFLKSFLFPKNIRMEDSKMVRQVYIVQKMSPTHWIQMKYKILDFTKFVNFFHEIKGPKWQLLKSQNLSLLLRFFYLQNPSNKTNWKLFCNFKTACLCWKLVCYE